MYNTEAVSGPSSRDTSSPPGTDLRPTLVILPLCLPVRILHLVTELPRSQLRNTLSVSSQEINLTLCIDDLG